MTKRDTYNYTMRDRGKIVYHGITDNPDRRIFEHENSGKRFTSATIDAYPCSRDTALDRERDRIESYERNHRGRKPRYNEK